MSELRRITYLSNANKTFDPSQMDAICSVSQRNNRATGITGILLYVDGSFLQVIEGPSEAIQDLLERVRHDRRHSGLLIVEDTYTDRRLFPAWSMTGRGAAYQDLHAIYSPTETFPQVIQRLCLDPNAIVVSTFLHNFFTVNVSDYSLSA